jgi:MoxR-like ATPase
MPADQPACSSAIRLLPWHDICRLMLSVHRLVMLVGEPGVGKTTFGIRGALERTGQPPEVLQGTPETELTHIWGLYALAGGATCFSDGPLPRALRQKRWLLVEEFNLIPLEVRASLLALRGHSSVTNPFTGEVLPVPNEFRLVATSNPESIVCHRNSKVAHALLDDFLILEVKQPPKSEVEELLRHNFPDAPVDHIIKAMKHLEWFQSMDTLPEDSKKRITLGYRAAAHFVTPLGAGMPERQAVEVAMRNKFIVDPELFLAAQLQIIIR